HTKVLQCKSYIAFSYFHMLYSVHHEEYFVSSVTHAMWRGFVRAVGSSVMAVDKLVHTNECGLPLNAIEWLETHHRSKALEREEMIRDLSLQAGSLVVDAGCGPGLWTPLLAQAIGPHGRIIGVDISLEALVTAHRRSYGKWYRRQVEYKHASLE